MTSRLFTLRVVIDECDRTIATALARRSAAVAAIRAERLERGDLLRDPVREQAIIKTITAITRAAHGQYDDETIRRVYEAIFDGCERLVEAAVPDPVDGRDPCTTRDERP